MRFCPMEPGTAGSYTDLYGLLEMDFVADVENPW